MDGKIPVLSRLLIISLLFVLSGNAYSDRDYSPGDVIFISLNQSESLVDFYYCLLYTSPSPRDVEESRMPSSA